MKDAMAVPVRCAVTARRFVALFAWDDASSRYVLFDVESEHAAAPELGDAPANSEGEHDASGRWISVRGPGGTGTVAPRSPEPLSQPVSEVKLSEFDLTDFFCPCCGYGKTQPIKKYKLVKCGKCNEVVCGARVTVGSVKDAFRCYEGCGSQGILNGSPLHAIPASPRQEELPPPQPVTRTPSLPRPETRALPAPQSKGLPAPPAKELLAPQSKGLPAPPTKGLPAPQRRGLFGLKTR